MLCIYFLDLLTIIVFEKKRNEMKNKTSKLIKIIWNQKIIGKKNKKKKKRKNLTIMWHELARKHLYRFSYHDLNRMAVRI